MTTRSGIRDAIETAKEQLRLAIMAGIEDAVQQAKKQLLSSSTTGVEDAVLKAGGQESLAQQLGVTQQAVSKWVRRGSVPIKRAVEIEAQFGVPRSRLISPRLIDLVDMPVDSEGGHCD